MGLFRKNDELAYSLQDLERFIEAQEQHYQLALAEVRAGKKLNHWIWSLLSGKNSGRLL